MTMSDRAARPSSRGCPSLAVHWFSASSALGIALLFTLPVAAVELSFRHEVAPILTKLGCNGGGCHGKATGRGGFQLSLFGFDSDQDYDSITRGSRGRRIFPAAPRDSLLLQKAAMQVPHGGGKRLAVDSPEYRTLLRWIAASAPADIGSEVQLQRITVEPAALRTSAGVEVPLSVTAHYSDGAHRDVTRLARYKVSDPSLAEVDAQGVVTTGDKTGEAVVVVQFQERSALSRLAVPAPSLTKAAEQALAEFPRKNDVDEHIVEKLKRLNIPPSPRSTDHEFLRRATLQIAGRLPTLEEAARFAEDDAPQKRSLLVDRLLESGDYADHFGQKWCDILRIKRRGQRDRVAGTIAFHRWVRNALARNIPYDEFAREIITATGDVRANPTAQWYAEVRSLDQYVDDTAQIFLGLRVGCARCHHHPFEKISQADYFGLAAFFGRVDRKGGTGVAERRANEAVIVRSAGVVEHPETGEPMAPRGLGAPSREFGPYEDPRHGLVDWMAQPDNPYFAKAFVNRMWAHFFGRGLVDPLDDLRVTNPSSNDALLEALARDFIEHDFDMRHVVRVIANSGAYQLSSQATPENLDDSQNHSRFYPQRMSAEVLLDAIDAATGDPTRYSGLPAGTRAVSLPDEGYSNEFLKLFGRPERESACECERAAEPSLSQSLFVMNSSFIDGKLSASGGHVARLAKGEGHAAGVEEMFLRAFSRPPSAKELQDAVEYLASESDARRAYANLYWALLNTKEFYYIH